RFWDPRPCRRGVGDGATVRWGTGSRHRRGQGPRGAHGPPGADSRRGRLRSVEGEQSQLHRCGALGVMARRPPRGGALAAAKTVAMLQLRHPPQDAVLVRAGRVGGRIESLIEGKQPRDFLLKELAVDLLDAAL